MAIDTPFTRGSVLDVLAQWLSARASLVLVLLMVQVGLMLALVNLYNASAVRPGTLGSRGGVGMACGQFEVVFAPAAGVGAVRQWALNFDAQIVAGPNARGAFELQVPQLDATELHRSLGALASDVRINPLCPSQGAS